ncbi:carbamoyltransferase C-terminal domain-containing protein [Prochlorococcus sp. MIT 1341]|uniref:carbamoyltransferase C-terminal domain-containing protein n=1 Tax=Prochlorococcus sp. MIT 1341 TaxID=3096221 RepID=UPI002A75F672|nr:carbamoyltransferase C-terminal domain-containing protein [Prochlorococcus sp. MIT 1341]
MYTVGICNNETASACLFKNGVLVSAVSEERFSRKKLDNRFPKQSIDYVLGESGLTLNEVDIAYAWYKGFEPKLLVNYLDRYDLLSSVEAKSIYKERTEWDYKRDSQKILEVERWRIDNSLCSRFYHYYHHEAHAASATLLSHFDEGVCLISDGRGDFESLTVWIFNRKAEKHPLKKIYSIPTSDSLGYFYGRITGLLGFSPMRHEGKITGLAAYGDPYKALPLMKEMIDFKDGRLLSNLGDLYIPYFKPYSNILMDRIKLFKKEDVAAAAQLHLETLVSDLLLYVFNKNNISPSNLMLAGGVFANVKVNQVIKELPITKNIFVQPQMGDGGLCLGASALAQHQKGLKVQPLSTMYLGPEIDTSKFINDFQKDYKLTISFQENCIQSICADLLDHKLTGLIRGRMEFGPRALGHRSILFSTANKESNQLINERLNRTEFMPFAPVIREEVSSKAFLDFHERDISLKYMTSTINCRDSFSIESPAVVHIDQTARPQVVTKESNRFMWDLLLEWEKSSEEKCLINTSFNTHEEPIVCSHTDAIKALKENRVDVIYIDDYRVVNRET